MIQKFPLKWKVYLSNIISSIKDKFSIGKIIKSNTIFSYNIYSSSFYKIEMGKENKFTSLVKSKKKHYKNHKTFSFLSNSDFTFETIQISKNIPDEEVQDAIYNIIYEELDNSLNYSIMFDEVKIPENEETEFRKFNIFIIDPNTIKYIAGTINQTVKYIDRIYPLPILLKSLYKFSGISDRTECFIYTYRDGTSLNIFMNGELIYSRALTFSSMIFFENFKELYEEDHNSTLYYSHFKKIVTDKQLFKQNPKYRKYLTKSLFAFFDEIDDVITYIKRNFNIDSIHNIYYYTKIGNIVGVSEYSKTLLGEHSFNGFLTEFSIYFDNNLDEIHYLLYLTYELNKETNIYIDSLKAPPSFFLRPIGKTSILIASSTIVALGYPLYNYINIVQTDKQIANKMIVLKKIKSKYKDRKKVLTTLYSDKNNILKIEAKANLQYIKQYKLLESIFSQKHNYVSKSEAVINITKFLNSHKVTISSIKYIEEDEKKYFQIGLIAKDEASITSLLQDMIKTYQVYTELIEMDSINHIYKSELQIIGLTE